MVDGFQKREARERRRLAELATWLLAPWTNGRQITPRDLLGHD
jgi:hypothetical protein